MSSQIIAPQRALVFSRPAMQSVSKIVLCVHPFYRSHSGFSHDPNAIINQGRGAEFMRKFWEGEMEEHAKEPGAFMIFVGTAEQRFMEAPERRLLLKAMDISQGRLEFVRRGMWLNDAFRGFVEWLRPRLSDDAKGIAFGEYTSVCVLEAAKFAERELGVPFWIDRYASVNLEIGGDKLSVIEQAAYGGVFEQSGSNQYAVIFATDRRHVPVFDFMNMNAHRALVS